MSARFMVAMTFALLLGGCNKAPAADSAKAAPKYDLSTQSNARYLTDFAARPGVKKTEDGLEFRVIKAGTGKAPGVVQREESEGERLARLGGILDAAGVQLGHRDAAVGNDNAATR